MYPENAILVIWMGKIKHSVGMVFARQMTHLAAYPALSFELSLFTLLIISRALAPCLEFLRGTCLLAMAAVFFRSGFCS